MAKRFVPERTEFRCDRCLRLSTRSSELLFSEDGWSIVTTGSGGIARSFDLCSKCTAGLGIWFDMLRNVEVDS